MTDKSNIDVDRIWISLKPYGRYQMQQFFLMLFDIFTGAFQTLNIVFVGYSAPFRCGEVNNISNIVDNSTFQNNTGLLIEYNECDIRIHTNSSNGTYSESLPCPAGYNFSVPRDRTIVTEFDLVCDVDELEETTQLMFMFGKMIGALVFTPLSDRYGRKSVHVTCHVILLAIIVGISFSPNYIVFAVLKFLAGGVQQGLILSGTVFSLELFPKEFRSNCEVLGQLFWATGCVLITPFGYLFRNISWRYLQLSSIIFSLHSVVQYWLMDESLRWLIANGKFKHARRVIQNASRTNKSNPTNALKLLEGESSLDVNPNPSTVGDIIEFAPTNIIEREADRGTTNYDVNLEDKTKPKRSTILDIFRNKHLVIVSFICWYVWITNSLTYYGLYLISSRLAGNRFLNYFFSAVVEFPACFVEFLTLSRIGRKRTAIMFHCITALSLIGASILLGTMADSPKAGIAATVLTLVGKMTISGSFSTIFLYTPELYPTVVRNVGIGMSSAAARVGAMVAAFAETLAKHAIWAPGALLGAMNLITIVLFLFLPETNNVKLPQTIEELNTLNNKRKQIKYQQKQRRGHNK